MRDTGGILFLFPPTATRKKGQYDTATRKDRLEALHPHDLTMSAREATEFQYSRIPFRQKRMKRAEATNSETRQREAQNRGRINGGTVVPEEAKQESKVNQDRQAIAAN